MSSCICLSVSASLRSIALAFVFHLPSSGNAAVGRTAGSGSVTAIGSATYSIPIVVPPGIHGLTPSLSLVYSSGSDNGLLGVGWSIGGLSSITRCPRTWIQDGDSRDVRNDYSDRYCLDGNKLRKTSSGTYGGNDETYQTELETFSRAFSAGATGNGPSYFLVEGKNGLIYEYGNTVDSRIESAGQPHVRTWALNLVRDRSGNRIAFTYAEDATNGSYRIDSIAYTSNPGQVVSATHTVKFVYESKPSNDIDSGYVAGSVVKQISRLDRIDVMYGPSTVVRRYELTYEGALSSTSKSRLASVQECAGSPLDCLPATSFAYQNGTAGLVADVTGVAVPTTPWPLDVNGDGRADLVYSSSTTSGAGSWMVMLANTSGGYNSPASTGVTNTNHTGAIPIDYNADGFEDLLVPYSGGTWWVMLGNSSGLATPVDTGAPATTTGTGANAQAMDVDGDGLEDLVWADLIGFAGGDAIRYRLRVSGAAFSSTVSTLVGPLAADIRLDGAFAPAGQRSPKRVPDFNGDGRGDLLYRYSTRYWNDDTQAYVTTPRVGVLCVGAWNINATWLSGANTFFFGDFNGDGKSDILYRIGGAHSMQFSTGTTLTASGSLSTASMTVEAILDWDGDGYDDALARHNSTGAWHVLRSTGEGFAAPAATGLSAGTAAFTVMDMNGDGLPDLGSTVSGNWNYRLHAGVAPDLLQTATDGFGNYVTFNYAPLTSANYTKESVASFPEQDYQGSMHVVTSTSASNGIGGSYTVAYAYTGARVHLQGRGFEGFYGVRRNDSRTGFWEHSYFYRQFPYIGAVFQQDVFQPNHTQLISRTVTTWASHFYASGYEIRFLPYVSQTDVAQYEYGGAFNGQLVRTSVQQNSVDSTTGTQYDSTTTVTEAAAGNGVQPSASYVQRVYHPAANLTNDTSNWCIGRPAYTHLSGSHSQYGGSLQTRTVNRTWDTANCRVTQEQVEPSDALLQVTTSYAFDGFGNINSQTVTGVGMSARTTTASWGSSGRFLQSATNPLSQTTQFGWDPLIGTLTSQTDPNSLVVSWQYDGFGRRTREDRPDGTATTWDYGACSLPTYCGDSTLRYYVLTTPRDTANGAIRTDYQYFDVLDRLKYDQPQQFRAGNLSSAVTVYDALGRVSQQSAPRFFTASQYWTSYQYDLLNRVTQVSRPISDINPTLQTTYLYHEGMTTRTIDALGKQHTQVANAVGGLARSIDHDGYYQNFDYDPFGNTSRVTDSLSNTLQSNTFNLRGMRTAQTDMDAGSWTFTPNALGEIVSQIDAKSQTTTFAYDLLGRPTTRTEAEGTSTWTWGTSAGSKNIGQLASVSGPGYSEGYAYDSFGRPQTTTITSDATYQIDYSYNTLGVLNTLTYPTSTSSYRLKLQYDYLWGFVHRVKDYNVPRDGVLDREQHDCPRGRG